MTQHTPQTTAPLPGSEDDILDLDALVDDKPPMRFKFGGQVFHLNNDADISWMEYADMGRFHKALWVLMGPDQYLKYDALDASMSDTRIEALLNAYMNHKGIDPGKSSKPGTRSGLTTRR